MGNVIDYIRKNAGLIAKFLLLAVALYFVLFKFKALENWINKMFTNISKSETPTTKDLSNPNYIIDSKIISNYVSEIVASIDRVGTDEIRLDKIYKVLKNTSKQNTISVWNEFKNYQVDNGLKYERTTGTFMKFIGDKVSNLYEVLSNELQDTQSEKNAFTNWTWLLRKKCRLI